MALEINCAPPEIAAGVDDQGNVVIAGIDRGTGIHVSITIDSTHWKAVYEKLGRLSGIGIYTGNRKINLAPNKDDN